MKRPGANAQLRFEIGNYYFGYGPPARGARAGAYDTERAEKYFREALILDPKLEGAHYQLVSANCLPAGRARSQRCRKIEGYA